MIGALAGLVTGGLPWRWIGLGAAVLAAGGLWLWIQAIQADRDRLAAEAALLERDLTSAVEAAERNAAALRRQAAEHKRQLAALEAERRAAAARAARLAAIEREIDDAPDSEDGPVAPVLGRALERLRGLGRAAAGGDEDRDGQAGDPAEPAALPGAAGAGG